MPYIEDIIRKKFEIKRGGYPPYVAHGNKTRNDICVLLNDLQYKVGAEIGVDRGNFSEKICETNSNVHLICVDPWKPYLNGWPSAKNCEKYFEETKNKLSKYDVEIKRMTSYEASLTIPNKSLDFIYIDGAHDFDNVMMDLLLWIPKVRYKGLIAGHDFFERWDIGVTQAVNAYTHAHGITNWYLTSWIWNSNPRHMEPPSFFWVQRER